VKRKAYTSDLTQKQFTRLEHLIPKALPGGAPRTVNMFEIINAILYVLRNGCVWRDLPHDFPKWQTVYTDSDKSVKLSHGQTLNPTQPQTSHHRTQTPLPKMYLRC
jgi:transposase